jgi:hypothetical protein
MGADASLRAVVANDRMMQIYQPAVDQTLDRLGEGEQLYQRGFANVGNCDGYYLLTNRGIHYCDRVKSGFLSKRYESRFFTRDEISHAILDQIAGPQYAYLRLYDQQGKMALVMWFQDEMSKEGSAIAEAHRAGGALGLEL